MQHKVKVTVIDKKLYPDLQAQYCADPESGMCSCYNVGDEFIFERYGTADDFWHMGLNTLKQTVHKAEDIAGGTGFPHCSEAWDAISRYIYTGLQGGSIMRGWMNDEKVMIGADLNECRSEIKKALRQVVGVGEITFRDEYVEVYLQKAVSDETLKEAVEKCGKCSVVKID